MDETRRKVLRALARQAGRAAEVVLRKHAFTPADKGRIGIILQACEETLLDVAAAVPPVLEDEVARDREAPVED